MKRTLILSIIAIVVLALYSGLALLLIIPVLLLAYYLLHLKERKESPDAERMNMLTTPHSFSP